MKQTTLAWLIFILAASVTVAATTTFTVHWHGTLRAVHGGDVSGKVPLQQFAGKENLYAIGPVAELDGEVTAIKGKFHITQIREGEIQTGNDLSTSASFLVWSEVSAWQTPVLLGDEANNHAQLEKRVESLAHKKGIDVTKPFPFLIEGVLESVDYHILSPRKTHQATSSHSDGAKKVSLKNISAKIIGFFSKNHEGVFTHRGSASHLHILEENGNSGHVDNLVVNAKTRILFPKQ